MDYEAYFGNPHQVISTEFSPKEKLLWSGQPPDGMRLTSADWRLIPFSLLWGGFAIAWEIGVIVTHAPFFMRLWGIPFVAAGLYFMIGRFMGDAYLRKRTFYGVTSDRVIIMTGLRRRRTISFNIHSLPGLEMIVGRSGNGIINFVPVDPAQRYATMPGMPSYYASRFVLGNEVRKVYELIRAAQVRG